MPTSPEPPIQLDELPREYDQKAAQRVLEAAVRRLADRPPVVPQMPAPARAESPVDLLRWCL